MTVKELIEILKTHDQELTVIYSMRSEYRVLEKEDIRVSTLQPERPDGHVPDLWGNEDPDMVTRDYLEFPGN
jgi:hypothetical protein